MRRFVSIVTCLLVVACSDATGPVQPLSGERLYTQNCARCHGARGEGTPSQPGSDTLSKPERMAELGYMALENTIRRGRPPRMPGFGHRFTDAAIDVLAAHVRTLSRATRGANPSASGAQAR